MLMMMKHENSLGAETRKKSLYNKNTRRKRKKKKKDRPTIITPKEMKNSVFGGDLFSGRTFPTLQTVADV
jgi:hypothetical protein